MVYQTWVGGWRSVLGKVCGICPIPPRQLLRKCWVNCSMLLRSIYFQIMLEMNESIGCATPWPMKTTENWNSEFDRVSKLIFQLRLFESIILLPLTLWWAIGRGCSIFHLDARSNKITEAIWVACWVNWVSGRTRPWCNEAFKVLRGIFFSW